MSASKRKSTTLIKAVRLLTYALENKVSLRQAAKDLKIDDKYVRKIRSSFKDRKDPDYVKFLRLYDEFHKQSGLKVDSSLYNKREFKKIADELKTYRRFFITTASADHSVSMPSLNAAKRYCRENNAALIVLPANWAINQIDPVLRDDPDVFFVYDDMRLNDNLRISAIRISPKQIDPVTGLDRLGQRDGSFIFASPKQRLKYVATSNANLPHCLMTTGAITLPQYNGKHYRELRLDEIARHDHVMGGIVVEIENDQTFHFRQVQFNSRGAFIDFGVEYHADYSKQAPAAAMVLGDLHCADLDEDAYSQSISMIKDLNPKYLVLHDVFDGKSISHWTREK